MRARRATLGMQGVQGCQHRGHPDLRSRASETEVQGLRVRRCRRRRSARSARVSGVVASGAGEGPCNARCCAACRRAVRCICGQLVWPDGRGQDIKRCAAEEFRCGVPPDVSERSARRSCCEERAERARVRHASSRRASSADADSDRFHSHSASVLRKPSASTHWPVRGGAAEDVLRSARADSGQRGSSGTGCNFCAAAER